MYVSGSKNCCVLFRFIVTELHELNMFLVRCANNFHANLVTESAKSIEIASGCFVV